MATDLNRSIKIYIDHSDAMKKSKDMEMQIGKLEQSLQNLDAQGKKNTQEYKTTEKNLNKLKHTNDRYQNSIKDIERVLKNLAGATRGELLKVQKELRKSMDGMTRDSKEYKAALQAQIAVEKELSLIKKEQNSILGKNATMWSRMADGFNKYFGIATTIIAGVTGISLTLRKLAEDVASMDDVYSDVMKTTGMTRDEVLDLNDTFKKMDTRTARDELNQLGRDAGKLGLSAKNDILQFVEAGNQINVALGEDLGEGAIKNIGKMTDVYALSTKELEQMDLKGKMLAIGSAINELGASSTASEAYMVSFAQRLGGVASQAGISIQNILGYASALDQSGQAVEMSATALQKFIMKLMGEPAKFAKLAGLEIESFNKLLQEDTNEAIKQVLSALSDKGGFQALIPIFKDMGLDGARAVGVLSALATNINTVNEAQDISNKAFAEGKSITEEYSIKNNNLQAKLEKSRIAFKDAALELGESLNPVLLTSTKWTTYVIKLLPTVLNFFEKYGKYLLYVVAGYAAYTAMLKISIALETLNNARLTVKRLLTIQSALATTQSAAAQALYNKTLQNGSVITKAYVAVTTILSAAKMALTGNIAGATAAMRNFTAVARVNPYVALLVAIPILFKGIASLNNKFSENGKEIEKLKEKAKEVREETEKYNSEIAKEESAINGLIRAIVSINEKSENRKALLVDLKQQYPEFLKYINVEKLNNEQLLAVLKQVNEQYEKRYDIAALKGLSDVEEKEIVLAKQRQLQIMEIQKLIGQGYTMNSKIVKDALDKLNEGNGWLDNDIDTLHELNKEYDRLSVVIGKSSEKVAEYKQNISDIQSNLNQQNTYEGVMEMLNKKGNELQAQREWVEEIMQMSVSQKSKNEAVKRLKEMENEYDFLSEKLANINDERAKMQSESASGNFSVPVLDDDVKKQTQTQKEELDLILEKLETKHQERILQIKKEYQSGEIDNDSDYQNKLFSQQQAYYLLQEHTIEDYLKRITDKTLRSDVEKQLAEIRNKNLDAQIKYQQKVEQIILDANPEAKELQQYENRLRDAGLFGVKRENLTVDQLKALELLEQQHNDNLTKIRKDREAKNKATATQQFEDEFAERKVQLQAEIANDEQNVSLRTSIGALTGEDAFNAEVELQRKRIALLQEEVAARKKAGLDVSKLMQNQQREELALTQLYVNEYKRRSQQYTKYSEELGTAFGKVLIGEQNALKGFADILLDILFDTLGNIINAKIAEATAVAIAEQAKAAAIAAAQPDSVISFGATSIARTAAISAIIMGALAVAKSSLKGLLNKGKSGGSTDTGNNSNTTQHRVVNQQEHGKYDVLGAEDGHMYRNVPYTGPAQTGMVYTPTLVGESGAELVVSSPDMKALQRHINYPVIVQALQDVRAGRVQQRADGKYNNIDMPQSEINLAPDANLSELLMAVKNMNIVLNYLKINGVKVNIYELAKAQEIVDDFGNFGKKV